jgi:hypothetical protein
VAYLVVQHSQDPSGALVDDYRTDDLVVVRGFDAVGPETALGFGAATSDRLASQSTALFGFGTPLTSSAGR